MKTLKSILAAMFLLAAVTSHAQVIFDTVANNDLLMVKHLLEKDASIINLKDQTGNTPLHIAALNGSVAIA
jgi:ankyrin repeat protein